MKEIKAFIRKKMDLMWRMRYYSPYSTTSKETL